jgi:hypothetical protein
MQGWKMMRNLLICGCLIFLLGCHGSPNGSPLGTYKLSKDEFSMTITLDSMSKGSMQYSSKNDSISIPVSWDLSGGRLSVKPCIVSSSLNAPYDECGFGFEYTSGNTSARIFDGESTFEKVQESP